MSGQIDVPYTVGPPHATRPRGRPKRKRVRARDENEGKKTSERQHKCKRCGRLDHRKNTCKIPINLKTESEQFTNPSNTIVERGMGKDTGRGSSTDEEKTPPYQFDSQVGSITLIVDELPPRGRSVPLRAKGTQSMGMAHWRY